MGNYRFRLSDMMPNAWFYKLKEMGGRRRRRPSATTKRNSVAKKQPPPPPPPYSSSISAPANSHRFSYPRKSYYFTREFTPNSPRKSNFRTSQTKLDSNKKPKSSSSSSVVSANYSCRATTVKSSDSPLPPPDYSASSSDSFRSDRILPTESFDKTVAWSSSDKIAADDIIINVDSKSLAADFEKLNLSDRDLPPIITKPVEMKKKKEAAEKPKSRVNSNRRHVSSPGLRLRVNSPRIGSRRIGGGSGGRKSVSSCSRSSYRRSLSDSVAIVKASVDPQGDFRESMVEMIVENNIKESKDLEDLLACYLSLNPDEYHELIIKVFKQIWFDLYDTPATK